MRFLASALSTRVLRALPADFFGLRLLDVDLVESAVPKSLLASVSRAISESISARIASMVMRSAYRMLGWIGHLEPLTSVLFQHCHPQLPRCASMLPEYLHPRSECIDYLQSICGDLLHHIWRIAAPRKTAAGRSILSASLVTYHMPQAGRRHLISRTIMHPRGRPACAMHRAGTDSPDR